MEDRSEEPGSLPEELFAGWLAANHAAQHPDFGALCRAHPEHARALAQLHDEWQRLASLLARAGLGLSAEHERSFAHKLREKYGSGVEPALSLAEHEQQREDLPSSELLRRLSEHTLKRSRYQLKGEIARGGMGAILKIWDEDLRRSLAMKVILGKGESPAAGGTPPVDKRLLARFLEEAQVTGQLDHPGIVPVHELGLDSDGRVYFTMKLVKGRDLKAIFELVFEQREGWNETRALGVILKVCEAMAYAHTKGVIHRDLKPANVMVGNFGEVYVMDWGLARVLGRADAHDLRLAPEPTTALRTERREERQEAPDSPLFTLDGDIVGTPAYMPPEQAQGQIERLSPRSDVYALGAMLYHLLARQMPYVPPDARMTNRMVLMHVQAGPPAPLASLRRDAPAELAAIVEKAMAREPERRYRDTLELAEDLRAYLEHRVVRAHQTGAIAELRKWVERNQGLAASIALAFVLLVAGLSASLVFKARADQNALLATLRTDEVLRLSALQKLDDLTAEADRLWPAVPENVPKYEEWLRKARELVAELPDHEKKLAELRARSVSSPDRKVWAVADKKKDLEGYLERLKKKIKEESDPEKAEEREKHLTELEQRIAELEAEITQRPEWLFADAQDKWWHNQLEKLVEGVKDFSNAATGLASSSISTEHGCGIAKRAEFARGIAERSVSGGEASARWAEATAAITDVANARGMAAFALSPQLGLLPIGRDPGSGLWEFAHLQTGEPAVRGPDGKLVLNVETGLVFVLLPGGTFQNGRAEERPERRELRSAGERRRGARA